MNKVPKTTLKRASTPISAAESVGVEPAVSGLRRDHNGTLTFSGGNNNSVVVSIANGQAVDAQGSPITSIDLSSLQAESVITSKLDVSDAAGIPLSWSQQFIWHDSSRVAGPVDKSVKLPNQVRHNADVAEDLIAGGQPRLKPRPKTRSEPKAPYTDAEMEQVLERWDRGDLRPNDPDFKIIIELAREGARLIKAHRRGARQQSPQNSSEVTRRLEAVFEAYVALSPKLQKHHTGVATIERLRKSVIKKLGLRDDDDAVSEETIKHDIRQILPLLKLVKRGIIPAKANVGPQLSDKTRKEMEAGKAALERVAAAHKNAQTPDTTS
jgi:hypothetical protein